MGRIGDIFDRFLPLTPHQPKPEDLVPLATFGFELPANQLVMFLGEAGVRAVVFGAPNAASLLSYGFDSIRVMVRYDDLDEAKVVLADFEAGAPIDAQD